MTDLLYFYPDLTHTKTLTETVINMKQNNQKLHNYKIKQHIIIRSM